MKEVNPLQTCRRFVTLIYNKLLYYCDKKCDNALSMNLRLFETYIK